MRFTASFLSILAIRAATMAQQPPQILQIHREAVKPGSEPAYQAQVVEDYAKDAPLFAALQKNSKRKATLTGKPVNVFASYCQDLSRGAPWILGQGRYLARRRQNEHLRGPSRLELPGQGLDRRRSRVLATAGITAA